MTWRHRARAAAAVVVVAGAVASVVNAVSTTETGAAELEALVHELEQHRATTEPGCRG